MPLLPRTVFSFLSTDIDPPNAAHSLQDPFQNEVKHFLLVRHISIAACALLFYDHILNAREEIDLVWKAPHSFAKFAFLLYQYTTLAGMTLLVHSISGNAQSLDDTFCKQLVPAIGVFSVIFGGIADVLAVLHVSALWKRNIKVSVGLVAALVVTTSAAIICRIIGLSKVTPTAYHDSFLNTCAVRRKPLILAVPWSAGLIFNVIVMALLFYNAFSTLRTQYTPFVRVLCNSGISYFVLVSAIRVFSLVLTVVAPLWMYGLVAIVSWPAFAIGLARFIFGLRQKGQYLRMIPADEHRREVGRQVAYDAG